MDFSHFDLLGVLLDLRYCNSRLYDISQSIDPSKVRSLYDDLSSLLDIADNICVKYSKD